MKFLVQSLSSLIAVLLGAGFLIYSTLPSAGKGDYEAFSAVEKQVINETINPDGTVVEIEETLTLVRSQLAVDSESQADITYNSTYQDVEVLEAYTITPDGKKIAVAANAIRTVEDDIASSASIYSDLKHKIIIFPNVKAGSRTYFKSKRTTFKPLIPNYYYSQFVFSPQAETQHFEYTLTYPNAMQFHADLLGVKAGPIEQLPNQMKRQRFTFQSLQVQPKELLQVASSDFAPHLYLSTYPNQEAFAKDYQARIAAKMAPTPEVKKLAEEVTKGITNPKDQAKALYHWVSREIRYVAIFLGDGGLVPHEVNSIIQNRYGDCKDHNALLIALLAAKGISATSAIINSGYAYTVPKVPVIGPFNHVITYIPQWDLYLDSTAELAPFGILPSTLIDKPTLLTASARIGRTPKPSVENNFIVSGVTLDISKSGEVLGKANTKYFGSADLAARYKYEGAEASPIAEKMVRNHFAKFRQTGEGQIKSTYVYDLDTPFELNTEFTMDALANVPGPGAMSIPVGLGPGELAGIANERPPEQFNYPYVCSTRKVSEAYQIRFPSNVKVTRIPKNVLYEKNEFKYEALYNLTENHVTVVRLLTIKRPNAVCQPQELQKFKDFYQVFIKDMRSQIFYE